MLLLFTLTVTLRSLKYSQVLLKLKGNFSQKLLNLNSLELKDDLSPQPLVFPFEL